MAGIPSMGSLTSSRAAAVEQKSFRHHRHRLPHPSLVGTLLATSGHPTGMEVSTLQREPPHQTRGASPSQQQQQQQGHRAKERKRFQAQCFRLRSTDRKSRARKVLQSACSVVAAVRRMRSEETARKILSQMGIRRGRTSHRQGRRGTTACRCSSRRTTARRTPMTATPPATLTRTTSTAAKCLVMPIAGRYLSPQPRHITLAHALLGLHLRRKALEEQKSSGTVTTSRCLRPSRASTSRFLLPNRSHSAGQTANHPA